MIGPDGKHYRSPMHLPGELNPIWLAERTVRVNLSGRGERVALIKLDKRWRRLARVVWARLVGPIPSGHVIIHLNGDSSDCRLENLQCLSRAENLRRIMDAMTPERRLQWRRRLGQASAPSLDRARLAKRIKAERRRREQAREPV